jgi:alkanesulfonate monooxygenase SsuD/methylene tetrahydromethanopterin reductase-like flavin-dependent oxidoreductase (luciferase family)
VRTFRFGFNVRGIRSPEALAAVCRRAERHGYDVALVPDHLGRNRRRFGLSYVCVHEPYVDEFVPVIEGLASERVPGNNVQ